MPRLSFKCLVSSVLLIFCCSIFAAADYHFESWLIEQGLPHRTLHAVLQSRDGYIWVTTNDGLARFDGLSFKVFNSGNSEGLQVNRLQEIVETTDGSLWISGGEYGLVRYKDRAFTTYTSKNGFSDNRIRSLYADAAANRLIILTTRELIVWQDEQFSVDVSIKQTTKPQPNRTLDNTGAFYEKEKNIVRRRAQDGTESVFELPNNAPESNPTAAYVDKSGTIWLATHSGEQPNLDRLYAFKNGNTSIYASQDDSGNFLVNHITEDRQGNIWISTAFSGLLRFVNGKFQRYTEKDGLAGGLISSVYEDREGSLWVATRDDGLSRMREKIVTTYTREQNGLSSNNIYPLYEDASGIVWIGAWRDGPKLRGGLDKYENGVFSNFTSQGQIASYVVNSVYKDRADNLWIGAYGGLTKYSEGKFTQYTENEGLGCMHIHSITEDRAGNLWLGCNKGLSLFRDGKFTHFSGADALLNEALKGLHESRDGTLWIGITGGLASYKDGKFTNYVSAGQVPTAQFRAIYEDEEGTLWFGTYEAGLYRLKDGKFTNISIKNGLYDNGVFQILEDQYGNFWMSSNRGIHRTSRKQLNEFADGLRPSVNSIYFNKKDGMIDSECNGGAQPAGFRSKVDGRLWFPTQKGIVVINPAAVPVNQNPPPVAIEESLIDREERSFNKGIELSPTQESLEIRYTGLSLIKPEQTRFKYQLVGLDKDWIEAGTQRSVNYNRLPPGEYIFRVTAANADGVWNEEGASLKITVKPPFYRTWRFILFVFLGLTGILTFAYRRRVSYLKRAAAKQEEFTRRLLESQEQERRRIAVELHDSLGQNLLIIKNWALLGVRNNGGGEAHHRFNEISETASQAIQEVREIAYNLRPYHLDKLGITKAVESMLETVRDSSAVEFEWSIENIDGFLPKEAEINFYRIVQECVNNVVKHSSATKADVTITRTAHNLNLIVEDNGKGFNLTETNSSLENGKRRSLGLISLIERSRILGGKPVIQSVPNQGTKISLTLNIQNKS